MLCPMFYVRAIISGHRTCDFLPLCIKSKPFQKCVLLTRTKLWTLDRYFLDWKPKESPQCLPGQSCPPAQARPPSSCRWRRWRRSRRWPSWCSPSCPLPTRRCNTRTSRRSNNEMLGHSAISPLLWRQQWWAKLLRLLTVNSLSYFVKIKY